MPVDRAANGAHAEQSGQAHSRQKRYQHQPLMPSELLHLIPAAVFIHRAAAATENGGSGLVVTS
jgi:hypothetical protein